MDSTGNSFTGSYSYTLDAKGRLNVPSKMRKTLNPTNDCTFVATRGSDQCIVLYPVEVWKRIEEKLKALNTGHHLNRYYVRNITRHAEFLQYDHQGRIPMPADLVTYAGIEKNVEIVGMLDRIEIWDPDLLEELESQLVDRRKELETIDNEINL